MALYENGRSRRIVLTVSAMLMIMASGPAIAQHTDSNTTSSNVQAPQDPPAPGAEAPTEGQAGNAPSDARQPAGPGCKLQNPTKLDLIV